MDSDSEHTLPPGAPSSLIWTSDHGGHGRPRRPWTPRTRSSLSSLDTTDMVVPVGPLDIADTAVPVVPVLGGHNSIVRTRILLHLRPASRRLWLLEQRETLDCGQNWVGPEHRLRNLRNGLCANDTVERDLDVPLSSRWMSYGYTFVRLAPLYSWK